MRKSPKQVWAFAERAVKYGLKYADNTIVFAVDQDIVIFHFIPLLTTAGLGELAIFTMVDGIACRSVVAREQLTTTPFMTALFDLSGFVLVGCLVI